MAILVIYNVTSNSVSAYVAQLDTGYSRNDRYIEWTAMTPQFQTHATGITYLNAYVSQGGDITLTGLQPSTFYYIYATINYTNGGVWEWVRLQNSITTQVTSSRPPLFYWSNYGTVPLANTAILYLPRAAALNGLSNNIRQVQAYKNKFQTSFPTIYAGQNFVNLVNQQASEINTLHGWTYLSNISADKAPSSNYMLRMQTYINNIT